MQLNITKTLATMMLAGLVAACTHTPVAAHPRHTTKNVTVTVLPKAHKTIVVGKRRYYVHNGVYYRAAGNGYRVVATPVGVHVATLPAGFVAINLKSGRYYRHGNTYYRAAKQGFVVVASGQAVHEFLVNQYH